MFRLSRLSIERGGLRRWCCRGGRLLSWVIRLRVRSIAHQFQGRLAERVAERERIARELHDTLLQSLFGLTLRFHTAASRLPADDPAREALDEALKQSDRVMQEGRERVLNLRRRRSDSINLADALTETGNQRCDFIRQISMSLWKAVPYTGRNRAGGNSAYRARGVDQRLQPLRRAEHRGRIPFQPGALHVRVRDDGRGINEGVLKAGYRSGHWGLPGMRERANKMRGELRVRSSSEGGTLIDLHVPANIVYRPENPKGPWPWSLFRRKRPQESDFAAD